MGRLNMSELLKYTTAQKDELGAKAQGVSGRVFRYVFSKIKTTKGQPVSIVSTATTKAQNYGFRVANSATAANSTRPAGIAIAKISASCYGYVQCSGPLGDIGDGLGTVYALTDGGIAANDLCVKDQATDGMIDTAAASTAGTQISWVFVKALSADSGSYLVSGHVQDVIG